MSILTWKPGKRDEVIKKVDEGKCPKWMKKHSYWIDLTRNRMFFLYEVRGNLKGILEANDYWTDIAEVESVPVMQENLSEPGYI